MNHEENPKNGKTHIWVIKKTHPKKTENIDISEFPSAHRRDTPRCSSAPASPRLWRRPGSPPSSPPPSKSTGHRGRPSGECPRKCPPKGGHSHQSPKHLSDIMTWGPMRVIGLCWFNHEITPINYSCISCCIYHKP